MTIKPDDLKKEAATRQTPQFAPAPELRCCYGCAFCWPNVQEWRCSKYSLTFGRIEDVQTYFNLTSFICADFMQGVTRS
jgi:hypothetical protein